MLANVLGAQQQQNVGNRSQYSGYIDKHKGSKPKSRMKKMHVKALDQREHIYTYLLNNIDAYISISIPYIPHCSKPRDKLGT